MLLDSGNDLDATEPERRKVNKQYKLFADIAIGVAQRPTHLFLQLSACIGLGRCSATCELQGHVSAIHQVSQNRDRSLNQTVHMGIRR